MMGRRRVRRRRSHRRGGGYGLFRPPRHKDLAEIVSFRSVEEARKAARVLKRLYLRARSRERRLTILRAVVLAANRARVFAERHPNISPEVRERLLKVSKVYRRLADRLKADYARRYY